MGLFTPHQLNGMMDSFPAAWCIAGDWALDVFLEFESRWHDSVELGIFRRDLPAMAGLLPGYRIWIDDSVEEWKDQPLAFPQQSLTARNEAAILKQIGIRLYERDTINWYLAELPDIFLPVDKWSAQSSEGIPVLSPEIVLLQKSLQPSEADSEDYWSAVTELGIRKRKWLYRAIQRLHPTHPWLELLSKLV